MQADIVIVGAGMVGSTLALALKDTGLTIVIVEAQHLAPELAQPKIHFAARVSAISLASQHILQHVNAWPAINKGRVSPYEQMYVWDGSGTGAIHFTASMVHQAVLGHIIENNVIQDALLQQLQTTSIKLLTDTRLEKLQSKADSWLVSLSNGETISAKLVIGADGACSKVRLLADMGNCEWDYLHHAIVTSVRCEKPHNKTAWQRFTDHGPLAFLPLSLAGDEHWCSIVWSVPPLMAEQLMATSEDEFKQRLGRAFEYKLGNITQVEPRYCIPLRQRHAYRYVKEGIALVGDAAHVIHPLAGQGVNLGFMDAAALAETLQQAVAANEAIGSKAVLKRFEHNRMIHNMGMSAAMEALERLFQADALPLRWLRNTGLSLVNDNAALKALLIRRAIGVEGALPKMARL